MPEIEPFATSWEVDTNRKSGSGRDRWIVGYEM